MRSARPWPTVDRGPRDAGRRSARWWGIARLALVAALAVVASPFAPDVARADDAARARFHDRRAREHYAAARYEEALRELFYEQRLAPNPRVVFNIALCFEQLGRDEETFLFYSEYLASDDRDETRREHAAAQIEQLSERVARVRVQSEPPDAHVYVDQRDRGAFGRTPLVVPVPEGTHRLFVERDGYHPVEVEIEAVRGREVTVARTLRRILGHLRVAAPSDGSVVLRGEDGERVIEGRVGEALEAPPGAYELEVRCAGYRAFRSIVRVEADGTTEVEARPEPLPPPTGAITVTSNAAGALVRLDGEPAGFAPLALTDVDVGAHELTLSQRGLRPWSGSVEVRPDERAWVTASLTPPPSTERSELTWATGALGVASLVAGLALLGYGADVHARWQAEYDAGGSPELSGLRAEGERVDIAAVSLLSVGALALGAAVLLYVATESVRDVAPSANVSREPR